MINFRSFPTTRYKGSKRKILPWIYSALKDVKFHSVLDGFGGTGIVSYLFKKMGKEVTHNDILKFNHISAKALIENNNVVLKLSDLAQLYQVNEDLFYENYIQRFYRGVYYLDNENKWIDLVVKNIINMNHYHGDTLEYKKAIAFHALSQSCIVKRPFNLFHRNNLNLRMKDVHRTFGNKSTWDKSFDSLFERYIVETNSAIFDSGNKCTAINSSIFDIQGNYDLVYLDPPYFSNGRSLESSDYLRSYHLLEGLMDYEEMFFKINFTTNNLRIQTVHIDNIITRDNVRESFIQLFEKYKNSKIAISYKFGGVPSVDWIVKTLKKFKRTVIYSSIPYKYALQKEKNKINESREILILGY